MTAAGRTSTALRPRVVSLPHTREQLRWEVVRAVRLQGYDPVFVETPTSDPYAYASWFRRHWRSEEPMIVVEQQSIPPKGALRRLEECGELWCLHPHDTGGPGYIGALACCKFSLALRVLYPDLADRVLADRRDGSVWWRHGLLSTPWNPAGRPPPHARNLSLNPGMVAPLGTWPGPLWPTTASWRGIDWAMQRALGRRGVQPHVHEPQTHHLGGSASAPLSAEDALVVLEDMQLEG